MLSFLIAFMCAIISVKVDQQLFPTFDSHGSDG